MTTTITATATFDKSAYNKGDLITVTVVASAVSTVTTPPTTVNESAALSAGFVAADGTKATIALGTFPLAITTPGSTTSTPETVLIDTTAGPITDSTGRVYTVSANTVGNLQLTATA